MKMEQLRQLVEVSKTHSINQAAANLYLSQSNLSTSLKNLETELGYQLLERSNRGARLTVRGTRFADYARSVVAQFDHLKTLGGPETGPEQVLSIANGRYRYVVEAAAKLYAAHRDHEPFRLNVEEGGRETVMEAVCSGSAELGIIGIHSRHKRTVLTMLRSRELQYFRLAANPLAVVVGRGNPLFSSQKDLTVTPEMLERFPVVCYRDGGYGSVEQASEVLGSRTAGKIVVNSRAALYEVLEHTDGFTMASTNRQVYTHAAYYPYARSFQLEASQGTSEVGWIKRRDHSPSPLAMEFLQILTGYYE